MKQVLITGASGFVGRQIARSVQAQGHRLTLVLRPGRLNEIGLSGDQVRIIETDDLFAESTAWWQEALAGIDTVIHSAWSVVPGRYLDSLDNIDCLVGSLKLAEAARRNGVARFVGVGTCFEYRLPNERISVEAPLGPVTLYSTAKLGLYEQLETRFKTTATSFAWARLFYLFGEGEHPARLFPTLHRKLSIGEPMQLSSGDKLRDFLDVREAGRMISTLVENGQEGPVNICSGQGVTLREIAETVADRYGRRDLLSFGSQAAHPRDPMAVVGIPNLASA
ncbi:MAG: hypothetical protein RLZZ444_3203 [Pseudomonadota bacterium]